MSLRLWLSPHRVRAEGTRPDYRFSLANERTFLAWVRTGLALIGGGFALARFLPDTAARPAVALPVVAIGAACAIRAVHHWTRCELAMRRGEDLPATRFPPVLALAVSAAALAAVAVVLAS